MANTTFQLRRSSVAGKTPNTSTLSIGELGLNLTDQILYSSNGTGVFELGANVINQTVKTSLLVGNSSVNTTVNSTSVAIGSNNLTVGTSLYAVSNGNVGIGTPSPSVSLEIAANDAILIPIGNTVQRPAAANGSFRYNTDDNQFEGYANGAWGAIAGGGGSAYFKGNDGPIGDPASANNLMRINSNTQSNNITVIAGENALMVGPITIGTGNTLTIDTGARVVIA